MSRASSGVRRRLGITVGCCTGSSCPSFGAARVIEVEDEGQVVLGVVFRAQVSLLERSSRGACARADCGPSEPGSRSCLFRRRGSGWRRRCRPSVAVPSPIEWQARQPRVSKQLLAVGRVAGRLLRKCGAGEAGLPDEGGDGLDFVLLQAELRHLGGRAEGVRIRQPVRNPFLAQLHADFFEVRTNLLDFLAAGCGSAARAVRSARRYWRW